MNAAARVGVWLLTGLASSGAHAVDARPQRIVSLNLCLDELALRLADRGAVASVLRMSRDPANANTAEAAQAVPANDGAAEQALSYHPDLILVGDFTSGATKAILRQVGAPVAEFAAPESYAAARRQILEVGDVLGESERAETLAARMDRELAEVSLPSSARRLNAIVLRPNGFTVGPGSIVDEMLDRAGLANLAAQPDVDAYQQMPLERVAMLGADVLIVNAEDERAPAIAMQALHHPIVAALSRRLRVVTLPARLWTCPGPGLVESVRLLVSATADLRSGLPTP